MYVITGATGHTGKAIALGLLEAGEQVRAIARDAGKLRELEKRGAEVSVGDLRNADFLAEAFRGAKAVYAMIPPDYRAEDLRAYQNAVAGAFVDAVRRAEVRHVVTLSSVGAHLNDNAGVILGLHDMEEQFDALDGVNVLHLRPTYFMENILGQIAPIKQMNAMVSPLRGDLKFPIVATRDIADEAVQRLLALDFKGTHNVQYILGQRDVTFNEIAEVVGNVLDKPGLRYIQADEEQARQVMIQQWGLGESAADAMLEFTACMNSGRLLSDARRTPANTTPTAIEEFVATYFQPAYEADEKKDRSESRS